MKLNSFLIILFIILKQIYAQCFEPIDEKRVKKVACGKWVTEKDINKVKINNNNKLVGENETMFQVTFTCSTSDTVMCAKAQRAFINAGNTIANTLKFKEKVLINATLMDFCAEENIETCALKHHIGLAGPQRLYSLLSDDDKIERIYPQALVKQFQFPEHPQYDKYDIFIRFNSRMDFYFNDDTTPIGPLQYDFEFTAIHELLHGLGFISYWQLYDEANNLKALCPAFALLNNSNNGAFDDIGENDLVTVKESIFDKYIIRLDKGTSITEYTKNIEQYVVNNQNATEEEFLQNLFPTMNEVYTLATTPKILGFLPHNSNVTDAVILETSIKYLSGSSLTHVDLSTYNNTSDYLMAYKSTPGKTVNDFISIGGNYSGGVIGPKTKSVLETIGYATESYPDPIKPQPFVKPQANLNSAAISSISNSVIFSQYYIFLICIIIILL